MAKRVQSYVVCRQRHRSISPKVAGNAEDDNQHGVVDVEAVGNKREHAHRAHDLQ